MAVNPVIDNAASQQAAVVGNLSVAQELKQFKKLGTHDRGAASVSSEARVKQALDSKEASTIGTELLADLAGKLAATGIKLSPESFIKKSGDKIKDEYDLMFRSGETEDDRADIRSLTYKVLAKKEQQKKQQKEQQFAKQAAMDEETGEMVKSYTATYAQYLINGATELKKKLEALETQLSEKGLSPKDLASLQKSVKGSMRSEITKQIRDAYIQRFLSPKDTMDHLVHTKSLHEILNFVTLNRRLGGEDFGGHLGNLEGVSDSAGNEAKQEVKDFVKEEIELGITKKMLNPNPKTEVLDKEIKNLLKLGMGLGLDLEEFKTSWQRKQLDLGLLPFDPPAPNSVLAGGVQTHTRGQNQSQNTGYELNPEDEREVLVNRMRAICMIRALRGNILATIETAFKMRKLKNGLIKLGYSIGDFEKIKTQMEKEGKALARMRCLEILKEVLWERATLYELSGPAHKLIGRKIKGVLNNLKRLGLDLPKEAFDALRDKANEEMFDISMEELQKTSVAFKARPTPGLEKKQALLLKLLDRLKEESNLSSPLPTVENLGEKV